MNKITVREFRANLKQYLDHIEGGGSVHVRGIELCSRANNVVSPSELVKEVSTPGFDAPEIIKIPDVLMDEVRKIPKCEVCEVYFSDWEFWEDGEERYVCDMCIRKKNPTEKMYKAVIKGYKKIL